MSSQAQQIVELLEQRLAAMNEVAQSLANAGAAIAACDIDGLEARILDQEALCQKIRNLDTQLEAMQARQALRNSNTSPNSVLCSPDGKGQDELQATMAHLQEVHLRVKVLNANHAELLRRSRRTVNALTQAYQIFSAGTYRDPATRTVSPGERV